MNNNKEWIFIINPVAGKGFANSLEGKIREMIQKHNIQAEIVFTEKEGHATQLSQKYLEKKARYFIGVGGDGTLNEIAVPLVYKPGVILGAIPGGTCNDFLQITGFPDNFTDKDWEIFFRGNSMPMDVGTCNGVIFLNGLGLGFDAHIAFENFKSPGKTKLSAKQKYITHILKNLLFYKEKKMIVRTTYDTIETDCFINTIGNGRRFAG